jgi:hypothetical protein
MKPTVAKPAASKPSSARPAKRGKGLRQGPVTRLPSHLLWTVVALGAVTVAAYAPVTGFGFVSFDDPLYVGNPVVSQGLGWNGLVWAFTTGHASNWHPVTWLSHMVDVELHGMNGGGHHVTNLVLHVANVVMLFLLLFRMTRASGSSAFVAALFALHPLHVESVAWVAERKDVLSTFFALLTLWAYLAYVARPGTKRYLAVVGCFALGLMSKPMLVTLPLLLLLLDIWPLGRVSLEPPGRSLSDRLRDALPLIREKLPLLAMSAASSVVTFLVQREGGAMRTLATVPFGFRMENAALAYVEYLAKTFWPARLSVLYSYPASISALQLLGALSILAAITVAALLTLRRRPYILVGWLWFVGMLVPVIGLVQVGGQALADRYTYMPLIGVFIIVAWGLRDLPARIPRGAVEAIALVVVLVCAFRSRAQAQYWSDGETLWRHAVELAPNDALARNNLGVDLADRSRIPEAIEQYRVSLQLKPDNSDARFNLGNALGRRLRSRPRGSRRRAGRRQATRSPRPACPRSATSAGPRPRRRTTP